MQFEMTKQRAEILNVNIRKEAAGDDEGATLATDIKLCCKSLDANLLWPLCPVDQGAKLNIVQALFNDSGNPRFYGLGSLVFSCDIADTEVTIGQHHFVGAKLKKFEIVEFKDNTQVDLNFTLQIHPTKEQVAYLAEEIKEEVSITIAPQPELPLETPADNVVAL